MDLRDCGLYGGLGGPMKLWSGCGAIAKANSECSRPGGLGGAPCWPGVYAAPLSCDMACAVRSMVLFFPAHACSARIAVGASPLHSHPRPYGVSGCPFGSVLYLPQCRHGSGSSGLPMLSHLSCPQNPWQKMARSTMDARGGRAFAFDRSTCLTGRASIGTDPSGANQEGRVSCSMGPYC